MARSSSVEDMETGSNESTARREREENQLAGTALPQMRDDDRIDMTTRYG